MKKIITGFILSILLSSTLFAAEHPAQALVMESVDELLTFLREDSDTIKKDKTLLIKKLDELIAPVIDDQWIAQKVAGKYWKKATPEQQTEFTTAFKQFLLTTYGVTLFEYKDGSIQFETYKPQKKEDIAIVKANFKLPGGDNIAFETRLRYRDGWKMYNFEVADFNMLANYRSSVGEKLRSVGFDGVIDELKKKNVQ